MKDETSIMFDLAVIGGGINGAGIARDAAGRGAKVILFEAGDLARGTSSASTKLIHGGLRYLEHYEFALVRESLQEREILWGIAPHIIHPLRFVLPHVAGLRPRWLVRLGLLLYDHIGGRKHLAATQSIALARHPAGAPLKPEFERAFIYSDCWADDARLVVLNARDAADRGAEIRTHARVTCIKRVEDHWRVDAGGRSVLARAVVNAGGPGVLDVLAAVHIPATHGLRLVRGSHIVVTRLFEHEWAYFFQLPDGRIFFAIPYEHDFTLIGTTDADHTEGLDHIAASEEEIAYLCEGANRFFSKPVTPADVVWTYSGVRPLVDDHSGKPEAATRGYRLELSDEDEGAPLLNVFGGKITTYRHLAEEAMELLGERIEEMAGPGWTSTAALPGGDFPVEGIDRLIQRFRAEFPFFDGRTADRLCRAYGTIAFTIFAGATALADCGVHFGHGLTQREVDHLRRREWAQSAQDILWRRTKLGLRFSQQEAAALDEYLKQMEEA